MSTRNIALSFLMLAMSGCAMSELVTGYKLRNVDPFATDAAGLRVAVALPDVVQPRPGPVRLVGRVTFADGSLLHQSFSLTPAPRTELEMTLSGSIAKGQALHVLQIAPDDHASFDAFRAAAQARKDQPGENSAELSVDPKVCRNAQNLPDRIPVSVFLKTAELTEYVPLTRNVDLLDETSPAELDKAVPVCT